MSSQTMVHEKDEDIYEEFDDIVIRADSSSSSHYVEVPIAIAVAFYGVAAAVLRSARHAGVMANSLIVNTTVVLAKLGYKVVFKRFENEIASVYYRELLEGEEEENEELRKQKDEENRALLKREEEGNEERHEHHEETTVDFQRTLSQHEGSTTTENFSAMDSFRYAFDDEMIRFTRSVELSSYCLCANNDLIVHPMRASDASTVQQRLHALLKEYDVHAIVNVVVRPDPVVATSCHKISHCGMEQNIGLYISEEGSVYWLSVAHGVVQSDITIEWSKPDATLSMHSGDIPPITVNIPYQNTSGEYSYKHLKLPTPYVCFSMKPGGFMLSEDSILYHGVDIMVGPLAVLSEEGVSTCFAMINIPIQLSPLSCKWSYVSIRNLPEKARKGGVSFSAEALVGNSLESYSWVRKKTLKGIVEHANGNYDFTFGRHDKDKKVVQNAILILCECDHKPDLGDSGSVWIQKKITGTSDMTNLKDKEHTSKQHDAAGRLAIASAVWGSQIVEDAVGTTAARTDIHVKKAVALASSVPEHTIFSEDACKNNNICEENNDVEAVAVTVAILKDGQNDYWVAAPLCSSLYALRKLFPKKFPEKSSFKGVGAHFP